MKVILFSALVISLCAQGHLVTIDDKTVTKEITTSSDSRTITKRHISYDTANFNQHSGIFGNVEFDNGHSNLSTGLEDFGSRYAGLNSGLTSNTGFTDFNTGLNSFSTGFTGLSSGITGIYSESTGFATEYNNLDTKLDIGSQYTGRYAGINSINTGSSNVGSTDFGTKYTNLNTKHADIGSQYADLHDELTSFSIKPNGFNNGHTGFNIGSGDYGTRITNIGVGHSNLRTTTNDVLTGTQSYPSLSSYFTDSIKSSRFELHPSAFKYHYDIKHPVSVEETNVALNQHPYRIKELPMMVKVHVDQPYPVHVSKPYPVFVTKKVRFPIVKRVHVAVNVPIVHRIPVKVPVHKVIPVPVKKYVHYPVKVPIYRSYPVPVVKNVPYPIEKIPPYSSDDAESNILDNMMSSHKNSNNSY